MIKIAKGITISPRYLLIIPLLSASCLFGSEYSLSMSVDTTRFDYAETSRSGNLLDTETNDFGDIAGFGIRLEPRMNGFYIGANYSEGETDYIGGTTISPTYGSHRTTTQNSIVDYTLGYQVTSILDPYTKMPFRAGVGYRGWLREISGVSGYEELYEWGYMSVGLGLHTQFSPDVFIGIDADYRKAFNAQMYENAQGYTFDLKNVYGYTVSVPIEIKLDHKWSAFGRYSYEYWNIGASNYINSAYEPDSETKNETLSIGVKYYF
jgi:opacity protein-like surface antigen